MTDKLISLRIEADAIARADRLTKAVKQDAGPGVGRVTRSYVLRVALEEGLKVLEKKYGRSGRGKRR